VQHLDHRECPEKLRLQCAYLFGPNGESFDNWVSKQDFGSFFNFSDLGGSGIHIGNTPFEGLAAADYVIRRNVIENCGLLSPRKPPPSLHVTFLRSEGATPLHRNLLIADNVFRDNTERPIEIQAARGVVVTGNRFENSARLVFRRPVKAAIQLSNVHGAVVRDNVTTDSRLSGLPLLSAAADCTDVRTAH
jgi:hypothetical protein